MRGVRPGVVERFEPEHRGSSDTPMPRRSVLKGRQPSGPSVRSELRPRKAMSVTASAPPTTATGASPRATRSRATAMAAAPEAEALAMVSASPPSPVRSAQAPARSPVKCPGRGGTTPGSVVPRTRATRSRSTPSRASRTAVSARSRARQTPSPPVCPGTWPAAPRVAPVASKPVRGGWWALPVASASHSADTPTPPGPHTPRPVTATVARVPLIGALPGSVRWRAS